MPEWYKDNNKYDLVLSNDIDSLVSCSIIPKDWEIEYFYDFENIFVSDELKHKKNKQDTRVWCDVALIKEEKCFDNHISRINSNDYKNPLCINPNLLRDVSNLNYRQKYVGSTALLVWSLYNLPLPTTEEGKMLLLAIDTTFKGYYYNEYRQQNKTYLCDLLGFEELYEVQERHRKNEFYEIIKKYNLGCSISINKHTRRLETPMNLNVIGELLGISLKLPDREFNHLKSFTQKTDTINWETEESIKDMFKGVVTLAFTYKSSVKYSVVC